MTSVKPSKVSPTSNIALSPSSTKFNSCDSSCHLHGVFAGKLFTACTKACTWASFTLNVLHKAITFKMLCSNVVRLPLTFIHACHAIRILVTTHAQFTADNHVVHALLWCSIHCLLHILLCFWDTTVKEDNATCFCCLHGIQCSWCHIHPQLCVCLTSNGTIANHAV